MILISKTSALDLTKLTPNSLASVDGFEPPTYGFGDHRSANWNYTEIYLVEEVRLELTHPFLSPQFSRLLPLDQTRLTLPNFWWVLKELNLTANHPTYYGNGFTVRRREQHPFDMLIALRYD